MNPPTVAVVGASQDRAKYGNKCVRAFLHRGYRVYPVNPEAREIEGQSAVPDLASLPVQPDRISIYLPPWKTRTLLEDLARFTGSQIWFNPGSATPEILAAAREAGLDVRDGCSIVDIGLSPGQFP